MPRESLREFFGQLVATRGEFLVHDDGFRRRSRSYADVGRAARAIARRLADAGVRPGDRVLIWGDNRPEWVAALWGALASGVVVVPIDARTSRHFAARVATIVEARVWIVSDDLAPEADESARERDGARERTAAQIWRFSDLSWSEDAPLPDVSVRGDDPAEIIFTSGATAEPKGVVLTHRNILANLEPIEREILKYRWMGTPFFPLRFLNLLPLSHMFGQSMATFIPPLLPGVTVFMSSYNPADIVRTIRSLRVSVLVCVPRMLEVLRTHLEHVASTARAPAPASVHWTRRWWRHRDIHRLFGYKFWSAVVGAAPLDPDLEAFWSRAGFLVIQGYGLTETAPVVTLNHPFAASRGSVGKPIGGVEVRLAPDGEVLVRGGNVTRGYYNDPAATGEAFDDGWLKTGDLGELTPDGHLVVRGRKKEVIVNPDGTKVFPPDVERVLNGLPGVRESAVVGLSDGAREVVHAVLVLEDAADIEQVVAAANARLEPHQRIRSAARWPGPELPRTEGTRKLRRVAIRAWAAGGGPPAPAPTGDDRFTALFARHAHGRPLTPDTSLDDLGLTSLDRVELMIALEQQCSAPVDEQAFAAARTLGDLHRLVDGEAAGALDAAPPARLPMWTTSLPARLARRALLLAVALPATRLFARARVTGLEHLAACEGPVIFAANHQSHLDTPVIFGALPPAWRYRLAPAMLKEHFAAYFHPQGQPAARRAAAAVQYWLAALAFAAFPLPQREAGSRESLRHMGALVSKGYSLLVFPEGRRTDAGEIQPFQPGVGMMASRLGLPVVPVRLEGLERVLHKSWRWPRRGPVRVAFGRPLRLTGQDFRTLADDVARAVREL